MSFIFTRIPQVMKSTFCVEELWFRVDTSSLQPIASWEMICTLSVFTFYIFYICIEIVIFFTFLYLYWHSRFSFFKFLHLYWNCQFSFFTFLHLYWHFYIVSQFLFMCLRLNLHCQLYNAFYPEIFSNICYLCQRVYLCRQKVFTKISFL